MHAREQRRQAAEALAVAGVNDEWMGAIEIAIRLGRSEEWRSIACALGRLAKRGVIESKLVKVPSKSRAYEHSRRYRATGVASGLFPSWLERYYGLRRNHGFNVSRAD